VPATDRSRIFTDGFTTKQPAGYRRRGLGLALVQRTVARAGGTIAVRSDRQGAAFTVVLAPLGARRPEAARQ
jgi:two-component system CitB family sensor kinase